MSQTKNFMLRQTNQQPIIFLCPRFYNEDELQGESNFISNQKHIVEIYAKQNGFCNLHWHTDNGYFGVNFERFDFQAVLADIEAGKIYRKGYVEIRMKLPESGHVYGNDFSIEGIRFIVMDDRVDSI